MQRILLGLATALAVVALPSILAAEQGKRPDRPRPDGAAAGAKSPDNFHATRR